MSLLKSNIFIVAAKRTPFGAYGGSLKDKSCTDLGEAAAQAAVQSSGLDPGAISSVFMGNVVQSHSDSAYLARHVGLRVGAPVSAPALTMNRLCGSGFQAVVSAVQELLVGTGGVALAGGAESMSGAPHVVRGVRFGTRLGVEMQFEDVLWATLTDRHIKTPMGITAETLAAKYGITRDQCDEYALQSQQRWKIAQDSGVFQSEMAPIIVKKGKNNKPDTVLSIDEHPRETTPQSLAKLPPVFKKDGVVTAGNASGVSDGAGAVLLATDAAMKQHKLQPLARVVGYSVVGCDPSIMGIGPVEAVRSLLQAASLSIDKIGIVEVNEAFAAQYLAVERELGLDRSVTNVCGGAIALGHPVGASGARILAHLAQRLTRKDGAEKLALGSACIGGGQGIAVLLERC